MIGLKQHILFTSKLTDDGIKYSTATVQEVFLQTVFQGLGYKYSDIRRELKPLLANSDVSDETILRHVMRITSEESEQQKRIGPSRRQTVTSAHSAQFERCTAQGHVDQNGGKTDPVMELALKVNQLTRMVEALRRQSARTRRSTSHKGEKQERESLWMY